MSRFSLQLDASTHSTKSSVGTGLSLNVDDEEESTKLDQSFQVYCLILYLCSFFVCHWICAIVCFPIVFLLVHVELYASCSSNQGTAKIGDFRINKDGIKMSLMDAATMAHNKVKAAGNMSVASSFLGNQSLPQPKMVQFGQSSQV